MHFEKDILKGKKLSPHKLKEEAAEELSETKKGKGELKKLVASKMVSPQLASQSTYLEERRKLRKQREKRMWASGKIECNMCNRTTPHSHSR